LDNICIKLSDFEKITSKVMIPIKCAPLDVFPGFLQSPCHLFYVHFQIVFWVVSLCSVVVDFRCTCCLHLHLVGGGTHTHTCTTTLHSITMQKNSTWISTVMKTSNLASCPLVYALYTPRQQTCVNETHYSAISRVHFPVLVVIFTLTPSRLELW